MPGTLNKNYNPVTPISLRGRLLVGIIRVYYRLREWLGGPTPDAVVPGHHEDPLTMTFAEKTYLGQKYYYRALLKPEPGSGLETHFHKQQFRFEIPEGFVPETSATLSAGGDLIPYEGVRKACCGHIWDDLGDFFFGADWVVANLESPADFSKPFSAAPEVMLHDMFFNVDDEAFHIFNGNGRHRGFDLLSVANNHSLDMGVSGLQQTLKKLGEKGIAPCGAVSDPRDLLRPVILEKKNIHLAFLAATFSFNKEQLPAGEEWRCNRLPLNKEGADMQLLVHQARAARDAGADCIVAMLHMGCAYQAYPSLHTVNNIHRLCDDSGIDLVIAGHPHHAQPMEIYESPVSGKRHFIVYSLGDFIACDIFKWGRLCLLPKFTLTKGSLDGKPHTLISGLQLKAGYMQADIRNGKVRNLRLLDYSRVRRYPEQFLRTPAARSQFEEVRSLFDQYVLNSRQQAELGMDSQDF
jgi:poly-gamma-glutamate synthesis protein (capsule biosynthesis protein)